MHFSKYKYSSALYSTLFLQLFSTELRGTVLTCLSQRTYINTEKYCANFSLFYNQNDLPSLGSVLTNH